MALTSQERVRQWLSRFITVQRNMRPRLTGNDLRRLGIPPGPHYKEILADLLRARLNGHAVTIDDERQRVLRRYSIRFESAE